MKRANLGFFIIIVFTGLLIVALWGIRSGKRGIVLNDRELITQSGVCPPFNLYDEDGNVIDPVNNINTEKPYSPKQTCGKCHNYEKITQGFHFQQGKKMRLLQRLLLNDINGLRLPATMVAHGVLLHPCIVTFPQKRMIQNVLLT